MKTIITAAAIATLSAGVASAMTSPEQLINSVQDRVESFAKVDVHSLTDAQIVALHFTLSGGDTDSEKGAAVRAILN